MRFTCARSARLAIIRDFARKLPASPRFIEKSSAGRIRASLSQFMRKCYRYVLNSSITAGPRVRQGLVLICHFGVKSSHTWFIGPHTWRCEYGREHLIVRGGGWNYSIIKQGSEHCFDVSCPKPIPRPSIKRCKSGRLNSSTLNAAVLKESIHVGTEHDRANGPENFCHGNRRMS